MSSPTQKAGRRGMYSGYIERLEGRIAPATLLVTNLHDAGAGSLRDAIDHANTQAGNDDIMFATGLHGTIALQSDLAAITDNVTISGPGAAKLRLNGNHHQMFSIVGSELDVTISGLKLSGGDARDGGAIAIYDPSGTVVLKKSVITGNRAIGDAQSMTPGNGGGIELGVGTLQIESCKITGNQAGIFTSGYNGTTFEKSGWGGGIDVAAGAVLDIKTSVISGNKAANAAGIHNSGEATIAGSTIAKNEAFAATGDASGGGILNDSGATLAIQNTKVQSNRAAGGAGDQGYDGGQAKGGGIFNNTNATLTISGSKITKNKAAGGVGGAAYSYYDSAGTGGSAAGGGVCNLGSLTISFSKISGNAVIGGKGGKGGKGQTGEYADYLGTHRGGPGGTGGTGGYGGDAVGAGIDNEGTLTLDSSVISGNTAIGGQGGDGGRGGTGGQGETGHNAYNGYPAVDPGPGGFGGLGGAGGSGGTAAGADIYDPNGTATVTNSVVSGNLTISGNRGATGATGAQGKTGDFYTYSGGGYSY